MIYKYFCYKCDKSHLISKPVANAADTENCSECGKKLNRIYSCNIIGTRDSFGIRKAFFDPKTNQEIDTWKKWEKAGYKNPLEGKLKKNPEVKNKIKEKMSRKAKNKKTPGLDWAERI